MHLHCLASVLALLLSCYKPVRSQSPDDGSNEDAPVADSDGLQQPPDEAIVQPAECEVKFHIK